MSTLIRDQEKLENEVSVINEGNSENDYLFYKYYRDISNIPLLTRDEEDYYTRKAKEGNQEAIEKLVNANLRFVISVAKKYQNQGFSLMDLISEGNMGLLTAIEKFEPERGYHFISYAVWWIRQSILKALSEKTRLIRLPLNRTNDLIHIERIINEAQRKGENASTDEIAKQLDLEKSKVEEILNVARDYVSFDFKLGDAQDSSTVGEFIADETETPEEYTEKESIKETVTEMLESLTDREKDIIIMRFGLDGEKPKSLQEIGTLLNLTKERIRQIEKKALRKLKHPSRSRKLRAALPAA